MSRTLIETLLRRFSRSAVAELRPRIASIADGIIDDVLQAGHEQFDFVPTVARPLCVRVMFYLIGFEPDDLEEVTDQVKHWADDTSHVWHEADYSCNIDGRHYEWWEEVLAERRALIRAGSVGPAGLMSDLLRVQHDVEEVGRDLACDNYATEAIHLLMTTGAAMMTSALTAAVARIVPRDGGSSAYESAGLVSRAVQENLTFEPRNQWPHLREVAIGKLDASSPTCGRRTRPNIYDVEDVKATVAPVGEDRPNRCDRLDEVALIFAQQRCLAEHLAVAVLEEGLRILLARLPSLRVSSDYGQQPTIPGYAKSLSCTLDGPVG